jgi:hypothetical protein
MMQRSTNLMGLSAHGANRGKVARMSKYLHAHGDTEWSTLNPNSPRSGVAGTCTEKHAILPFIFPGACVSCTQPLRPALNLYSKRSAMWHQITCRHSIFT